MLAPLESKVTSQRWRLPLERGSWLERAGQMKKILYIYIFTSSLNYWLTSPSCHMLMSLSIQIFCFSLKKGCDVLLLFLLGAYQMQILSSHFSKIISLHLLNPLLSQADKEFVWSLWKRLQVANPDLTQAVSLVVERWVDSSFTVLPERLSRRTFPLSRKWREASVCVCVKVVQGVFKAPWPFYWGYDGIWCRCWFKPSYPWSSSSNSGNPFNENTLSLLLTCWTVETVLPNTCLYWINCEIEYDLFCRMAKLHWEQWHGNL